MGEVAILSVTEDHVKDAMAQCYGMNLVNSKACPVAQMLRPLWPGGGFEVTPSGVENSVDYRSWYELALTYRETRDVMSIIDRFDNLLTETESLKAYDKLLKLVKSVTFVFNFPDSFCRVEK